MHMLLCCVNRFSSRRFFSISSSPQPVALNTSGWWYKPWLESVQVCEIKMLFCLLKQFFALLSTNRSVKIAVWSMYWFNTEFMFTATWNQLYVAITMNSHNLASVKTLASVADYSCPMFGEIAEYPSLRHWMIIATLRWQH